MNSDLLLVLIVLAGCAVLLAANRPRMDVVALLVIVILPLLGVLSVPEALAGFSDPSVVLIAALFVVGEGLVRTGVAHQLGGFLADRAGKSETRLLILLMFTVTMLGAVMSSTGIVALFIPVVLSIAARRNLPPGRLMMPLSFAGLISGMMTLVATPPNMIIDSALKREGFAGLGFFSFTPIGIVVLVLGIAYMLVARRWLNSAPLKAPSLSDHRSLQNLIDDYHLLGRGCRLRIRPGSPWVGKTFQQLALRDDYQVNVVGIERRVNFHNQLLSPNAYVALKENDVLLVDRNDAELRAMGQFEGLQVEILKLNGNYLTDQSREVGMAEVMLPPESGLIGKSVREANFRSSYGLNVVGVRRSRKVIAGQFLEETLKLGDTLLVIGPWKSIRQLQTQRNDFVVLSVPAEIQTAAPARSQAPFALLSLLVMIVLMVSGLVPNVIAVLIACMLMGLFGCVDMDGAYKAIHWQSVIVIVGMMPFALALEKTGGITLAVDSLMSLVGDAGPRVMLAALFAVTSLTGLFISNTATAVLMAPIAISVATHVGASPEPFAVTVALAASAAFMTPVSSPVNTLVLGPGRYRFSDYLKVGMPFTVLVMVVCVVMVPWLFPLD